LFGSAFLLSSKGPSEPVVKEQVVSENGLHWHPRLDIYIEDEKQEIPSGIGLAGVVHKEMHTHDEDAKDGVIHMEMNGQVIKDETKLSNFFRIWGKEFNSAQIFDKKNSEEGKVKMVVNGRDTQEFENYEMHDGDVIEIRYE